jgi:hypothetical protein
MAPGMPGMDMSRSTPTLTPTMAPDMPGMDMSGSDHADTTAAAARRPLAPVLGTFGGGSAAVLFTAGMMRRRDRALTLVKRGDRLAGKAKK